MGTNSSLSARISRSNLLRYTLAVVSALLASAVCSGLQHFVGIAGCYAVLLLAVTFSAWFFRTEKSRTFRCRLRQVCFPSATAR